MIKILRFFEQGLEVTWTLLNIGWGGNAIPGE
jgi:hypothetical protein